MKATMMFIAFGSEWTRPANVEKLRDPSLSGMEGTMIVLRALPPTFIKAF